MILAGAMAALVVLGAGIGAAAEVWTEVACVANLPTATVSVTPTTATVDVAFSTVSSWTLFSTLTGGIKALGFDATHEQGVSFSFRVPDGATVIYPEVACVATSGTVTTALGVAKWGIEYVLIGPTLGTAQTATNTSRSMRGKRLELVRLGTMTVSGASYVSGRLYRDADASADTCTRTAWVVGFGYWRYE